jgi:hypothetical protein
MSKLLLLLCFLVSGFSLKAQSILENRWKAGCYYDKNNHKFTGLFASYTGVNTFDYKKNRKSKSDEYDVFSIRAIVIDRDSITRDSFVVSHAEIVKKAPLLRVIVDGPVKLFLFVYTTTGPMSPIGPAGLITLAVGFNSSKKNYYYGENPDNLTEMKKKDFIAVMSKIMESKTDVVERIKDKTYHYRDMTELANFYKTGVEVQPFIRKN